MATTLSLTHADTVWVTTYWGGETRMTCFDVTVQLNENTQVTASFTRKELEELLRHKGIVVGLAKPEFDNRGSANDRPSWAADK